MAPHPTGCGDHSRGRPESCSCSSRSRSIYTATSPGHDARVQRNAPISGGLLFGDVLGTTSFPALDATAPEVRAYFLENGSQVRALSLFHVLSAIALVAVAAYIYAYLRRESIAPSALAAFALAGAPSLRPSCCSQRSATARWPNQRSPAMRRSRTRSSCSPPSRAGPRSRCPWSPWSASLPPQHCASRSSRGGPAGSASSPPYAAQLAPAPSSAQRTTTQPHTASSC